MFLPYVGIGNVITSVGYYSFLFVNTQTQLYSEVNSLYPNSLFTPTFVLKDYNMNISFNGQIFWIAGAIIWIGLTFSQKYSKKMP
jgi:hypothetical protein